MALPMVSIGQEYLSGASKSRNSRMDSDDPIELLMMGKTRITILTFLLVSCGDTGENRNVITVEETSSCGKEGDKYVCHVDPGTGNDPDGRGVDDTGKATRDFWRESVIFHAQKSGSNNELWSSARCMDTGKAKAIFSTDGRLRIRVVPRRLPAADARNKNDQCGNVCKEVLYNVGKMNIKIGIKKPIDSDWTQEAEFREIGIDKASQVVDFEVPGGLKAGESVQLGVLSVEADEYCRSFVDQGYNSETYPYWHQYCSETGFDRMGVAAVKCVKLEIQVVNDYTNNFP